MHRCQLQNVVAVARNQRAAMRVSKLEHSFVRRIAWKRLAQESNFVTEFD